MLDALATREFASILILTIPVAVLATLALIMASSYRRRQARTRAEAAKHAPVSVFSPSAPAASLAAAMFDAPPAVETVSAPPAFVARDAGATKAATRLAELQGLIAPLRQPIDSARFAAIYLDMADAHLELGDVAARMQALRSAAGIAAQHGPRADHARARLALAEAAFEAHDLTGACEQWQMARSALFEDGQKAAYDRVDRRMRDNGCPTDWVLTDF